MDCERHGYAQARRCSIVALIVRASSWRGLRFGAGEMGMQKSLFVFGASGHGKVVASTALAAGWVVAGFADDNPALHGKQALGLPICAPEDFPIGPVALAIGNPVARERVYQRMIAAGCPAVTLVHPRAYVEPSATVGTGTFVAVGAVLGVECTVGVGVIVNTGASVDHDCVVEDFAHVAAGARLCGNVKVGRRTWVGVGSSVRQQITIGADTMIGAGSVVVRNFDSGVSAWGNPARVRDWEQRASFIPPNPS